MPKSDLLKYFNNKYIYDVKNRNDAQLLTMGGVLVSIIIISSAIITINLSNVITPLDKNDFIKHEFDNVRKEFGVALQDKLKNKIQYVTRDNDALVSFYFNDISRSFAYIEFLRGNYFKAEYLGLTFDTEDRADGVIACLTLDNTKERIIEEVEYYISS